MTNPYNARGGAAVAALNRMDEWEANLVLNLRLWCEGPAGKSQARQDYYNAFQEAEADRAWQTFESLLSKIIRTASRPLVRHEVGCNCVGSDECVFLHLVRTASDGHLNDAALIATLLSGPAHAEHIALMAGEVGTAIRHIHKPFSPANAPNEVRLH
ncbi:hypothetical protein GCM10007385_40260 [Tateyamaria omphalii]|uniref:hypothetical protein n=1 Tax=Tateyamaria omphalii TaxID=299262 RepID=UPI0016744D7A|nr:hypothetical protein [Tateyamaria omphalii]GGX67127.1 hypothetical protein GCM10007385_40260 [Tateyamaria omphalii]